MQWVFDKRTLFGDGSSHLSLVSSGADALVGAQQRGADRPGPRRSCARRCRRRAAPTLRRAVVVREKRATFSVAPGQPPRPATRTAVPGLFLAGDWIDTGLPATIESAVVSGHAAAALRDPAGRSDCQLNPHELHRRPLSGDRAQGEEPAVVPRPARAQPARRALSDLDVTSVRALMGRIEVVLGPARRREQVGRADPPHVRHRQLLVRAAGPRSTSTSLDRRDPARPRRPHLRQLSRVGAPRRQALSADLAADRARGRRPHQGGARLAGRPRRTPSSSSTSSC